mmetsp:Transcript_6293/g.13188  ORF Transcript_6293/g.13188 Transcript_6293/m.13188 type:complete len:233 (-) Transcript_6293:144-842(-)
MLFRPIILAAVLGSAEAFAPATPVTFSGRSLSTTRVTKRSSLYMGSISCSDIKTGMTLLIDKEPHKVINFSIMKQARGAAKTTIKFKNLKKGNTVENTYRSQESFDPAEILRAGAQFTYEDNGNYIFMDNETFEETLISSDIMGDNLQWITEGAQVTLIMFDGLAIDIQVPKTIEATIVETEPNMKGNTSGAFTKPATLDCGAVVTVPGFLETGELIRVDTEKKTYLDRVKS